MRLKTCLKTAGALAATGALAACGGGNGSSTTTTPPPAAKASLESMFGTEFATIFDASSTAQPATLDANAVPALAPAAQPIAFPTT